MQQYFVDKIENNQAVISGQDAHHIKNVMRSNIGDNLRVCHNSVCYLGTIEELTKTVVLVSIGDTFKSTELKMNIDIAQALIKREKFELMIQKSSELGVRTILPLKAKNAVVKINQNKVDAKLTRWNTIAKEACEQSERSKLSTVTSPKTLKEIDYSVYDKVFVLYAREENNHLRLENNQFENILIVIGPEGGFTQEEITALSALENSEVVSLGHRILRSETASLYMLSVLGYMDGVNK